MVCSLLANIYRDRDKQPTAFEPADFLPGAGKEQKQTGYTEEQWKMIAKQWGAALGGV